MSRRRGQWKQRQRVGSHSLRGARESRVWGWGSAGDRRANCDGPFEGDPQIMGLGAVLLDGEVGVAH